MGRTTAATTGTKKSGARKASTRSEKASSTTHGNTDHNVGADAMFQSGNPVGSIGTRRCRGNSKAKPVADQQGSSSHLLEETSSDVLLGRGSGIARHPGNVFFRRLVSLYRPMYQKEARNRKMDIANMIIEKIEGTTPPGRFLEPSKKNPTRFIQVDKKRALEKTSQALREKPSVPSKQKKDSKRRQALKSMAEVSAANAAFTLIAAAAEAVRKREAAAADEATLKQQPRIEPRPTDTSPMGATPQWVVQRMSSLSELELAAVMDLTTLSHRTQLHDNDQSRSPPRNLTSPSKDIVAAVGGGPNLISPELPPKVTIDTTTHGATSGFVEAAGIANFNTVKAKPPNSVACDTIFL